MLGLSDRVFPAAFGTFDLFTLFVDDRLKYCELLGKYGPLTTSELAAEGTEERYTREWLELQAVGAFECIHDAPDQGSTPATMRRIAADDGIVIVMDEKVSEAFHPDADEVEQLMYGFSNFICLPDGMTHLHRAGTGTVMRPDTLRKYAQQAGFSDIEILPIETDVWRFYRLV